MTLHRHALNDAQWARISPHIPAPKGRHGRDDRLFLDAVLWIAKTGSPWRDMPERLGAWAQVYQRFARWSDRGHFEALFCAFQTPDLEQVTVDSTSCKAHQASAGAQKKRSSSDWCLSWRLEYENPCSLRCPWQSDQSSS